MNTTHCVEQSDITAFSKFVNNHLGPDSELSRYLPVNEESATSLFDAFYDGILLSKFVNLCAPNTIDERTLNKPNEKRPELNAYQINENFNVGLNSCRAIGIKVINIDYTTFRDRTAHLLLGLIWQLVRKALEKEIRLEDHPEIYRLLEEGEEFEKFRKLPADQILIRWINYHLKEAKDKRAGTVANFTTDLNDGYVYNVLLEQMAHVALSSKSCSEKLAEGVKDSLVVNKAAIQEAANAAKTGTWNAEKLAENAIINSCLFGVKPILHKKDILSGHPKLNLAFCAALFNACPALEEVDMKELRALLDVKEEDLSVAREERVYANWINNLGINSEVQNFFEDIKDGLILAEVLEKLVPGSTAGKKLCQKPVNVIQTRQWPFNKVNNCNTILEIISKPPFNINTRGIDGKNIADGYKTLVLAFMWQIMFFDLAQCVKACLSPGSKVDDSVILQWAKTKVNAAIDQSGDVRVEDDDIEGAYKRPSTSELPIVIPSGWTDKANMVPFLFDLIHVIEPRAVDYDLIVRNPETKEDKINNAKLLLTAARRCGFKPYAVVEDIIEGNKKLMIQFVASIYAGVESK